MSATILNDSDSAIDRLARKRAGAKLGWYIHATVYACINLMLVAASVASGRGWAVYPALGWGVGLAIHGLVVFFVAGGSGLHERLVEQERRRLAGRRDAW